MKQKSGVAFRDGTVAVEDLPFPFVHYPGHYGVFFGFSGQEHAPIHLCSCSRVALESYAALSLNGDDAFTGRNYAGEYAPKNFLLGSNHFPLALVRRLMNEGVRQDANIVDHVPFGDHLCHRCNAKVPELRYCDPMYGGEFKQRWGWYANLHRLELGLPLTGLFVDTFIPELCPQEALDLYLPTNEMKGHLRAIEEDVVATTSEYLSAKLGRADEAVIARLRSAMDEAVERKVSGRREYRKMLAGVDKLVEDETRVMLGHPRIGEGFVSETILYHLVRSAFPEVTVLRHHRPEWLERLELDLYLVEPNVGVEYQGIQHDEPVDHWGGEEGLRKLQERDRRKARLCKERGVPLVYFDHGEDLTEDLVREVLGPLLRPSEQ